MYVSWALYVKVLNRKTLTEETLYFLEKRLFQYLNFGLRVTCCFLRAAEWPTTNLLECIVIFL